MPKNARTYIHNQYNFNCCQSSRNTQTSETKWYYNKQSTYWLYFEHLRYKIHKAETQFQTTGSLDYWNKVKTLQHIQYQLVENAVNLQEETVEELIPKYTIIIDKKEPVQPEYYFINETTTDYPQETKEIKEESDTEKSTDSDDTDDSDDQNIPSNQQELEEDELSSEEETLYTTYLYLQPQTPISQTD
jgi:hypothetical protein